MVVTIGSNVDILSRYGHIKCYAQYNFGKTYIYDVIYVRKFQLYI